jgi:anti-sigma B factor antagonist
MKPDNLPNPDVGRRSLPADKKIPPQQKQTALTLEFDQSGGVLVLHCRGRIVFSSEVRALSTLVAEILPSAGRMVVDLAGVDSIDSGGLGELVLTHLWAEAAGYMLKFGGPTKSVRHLFEVTNLASVLDTYDSVRDAVEAMGQDVVLLS